MTKRVLLTGIGGFIGAHCLEWWLEQTDWDIIGIDSFCHKGWWRRIDDVRHRVFERVRVGRATKEFDERVKIYCHDLSTPLDDVLINQLLDRKIESCGVTTEKKIHYIVNMASDSAVERSVTNPRACWTNNTQLAMNMLEFARIAKPDVFVQISTDEVYGEAPEGGHKEWSSIIPSNVYSASKAAQEALAVAYWRTYDVPVVITNTMNVIGEWQHHEKMVPKIIEKVVKQERMPIYGDKVGENWVIGSRVYTDAKCKADAIKFILENLNEISRYRCHAKLPDRYNIIGDAEFNNLEIAEKIAELAGMSLNYELVPSESARPGYDRRYALDGTKLLSLGWKPPFSMDETLERIVSWSLRNQLWLL